MVLTSDKRTTNKRNNKGNAVTGNRLFTLRKFVLPAVVAAALSSTARAATIDEIANLKGPDRENVLIEGAKREGKVMIYSAMIEDQALRPIIKAFHEKYPFVEAEFWRADTRDLINKALAEARARAVNVDIVEGGGVSQGMIRAGVTQAFSLPALTGYDKDLYDAKGMWAATRLSYFGLAYNTRLVSEPDAPKVYDDLLDPKWKGSLAWAATTETGGAAMFITFIRSWMGDEKGEAWLAKLAQQKIANLSGSPREVVNKVMDGEYAASLGIFLNHPIISAQKGAPVAPRPLEPVVGNASVMILMKAAPHPHAAILMMDFLLSQKGQEVIRDADYLPADSRVETPKALDPIIPTKANLQRKFLSEEDLFAARTKSLEIQKKYFQN